VYSSRNIEHITEYCDSSGFGGVTAHLFLFQVHKSQYRVAVELIDSSDFTHTDIHKTCLNEI
jgi:hypothetical protein